MKWLWGPLVHVRTLRSVIPTGIVYQFYRCGCSAMFTGITPGGKIPTYCPTHEAKP